MPAQAFFFGPPRLEVAAQPIPIARRKVLALLAYLAVTGRPHSREALSAFLWPELDDAQARADLRRSLSLLQKALAGGLALEEDRVSLAPGALWTDVGEFRGALAGGQLARAAELYRDSFLAGFTLRDSVAFDDWQAREGEALRQQAVEALRQLALAHEASGQLETALGYARQWAAADGLDEAAHRQLMRLLAQAGQRPAALRQYAACARLLRAELGVEPDPETTAVYQDIEAGRVSATAAPAQPPARQHNLPEQLTPFVGRQAELAALAEQILSGAQPLVTVVGEGGVGKTRLALAAAQRVQAEFAGGAWLVPLAVLGGDNPAALRDQPPPAVEASLAAAIAAALGLVFVPGADPARQVLAYLRARRCLLLLDNFEVVAAGAGLVAELVAGAPGLRLLVTSREPLRLQAESVFRLAGLPVPAAADAGAAEADSLRLFAERAERAGSAQALTPATLPAVVAICQFVGGLPLGIELAAAWARWLAPAEILAALRENAAALETPLRDVPARHRSLFAVGEYSWALLSPAEQQALAQLAAFQPGFDLPAALAVTGATRASLFSLVDKSLVQRLPGGRFGLHDVVSQLAAGKLPAVAIDQAALLDRHAAYYLDLAAGHSPALNGREPRQALRALQANHANLRQAWQHAVQRPLLAELARGLEGLAGYWQYAGLFDEAGAVLRQAITQVEARQPASAGDRALLAALLAEWAGLLNELAPPTDTLAAAERAVALAQAAGAPGVAAAGHRSRASALWRAGRFAESAAACDQARALCQGLGLAGLEADVWRIWAACQWRLGRLGAAQDGIDRSLALAHGAGDERRAARANQIRGILAQNGQRFAEAQQLFETLWRQAGALADRRLMLAALSSLGQIAGKRQQYDQALAWLEQEQRLARELGGGWGLGSCLSNLGDVRLQLGDYADAEACYHEARQVFHALGAASAEGHILAYWALLCSQAGRPAEGRTYGEEALRLAEANPLPRELAFARQFLAPNLLALGELAPAAEAYAAAGAAWLAQGETTRHLEALAGLARVALAQGDPAQALAHTEPVVAHLLAGEGRLEGADAPGLVYLAAYQVLAHACDSRAGAVLAAARRFLDQTAAHIQDPRLRASFLAAVPANRELAQL